MCLTFPDPGVSPSHSEVPLSVVRAAVLLLVVAVDDRSAAAPEAPDGSARDEHPADGFAPGEPAASADPAQIEELALPLAFDRCDSVPVDDSAPDDYSDTAANRDDCSEVQHLDVRSAAAVRTNGSVVDSSQRDCSAARSSDGHFAEAAHMNGSAVDSCPADYLEVPGGCSVPVASAAADSLAAPTDDHFAPAARSDGSAAAG